MPYPLESVHAPPAVEPSTAVSRAEPCALLGPTADLRRAMQALRQVIDPQVGENIVELGLIESLRVDENSAELLLVTTAQDCLLSDLTADEAFRALQRVLPERDLFVRHDAAQDWKPERMSPELRRRLPWLV